MAFYPGTIRGSTQYLLRISEVNGVVQFSGEPRHMEEAWCELLGVLPKNYVITLPEFVCSIDFPVIMANSAIKLGRSIHPYNTAMCLKEQFSDSKVWGPADHETVRYSIRFNDLSTTCVLFSSGSICLCGKKFEQLELSRDRLYSLLLRNDEKESLLRAEEAIELIVESSSESEEEGYMDGMTAEDFTFACDF